MRHTPNLTAVVCLALALAGCEIEDWGDNQRYKEDFRYTHNLQPGGRISIDNQNGSIEIIGWEKDSVEIEGTKYAASEQALSVMKIDITSDSDVLRIRTIVPSGHRRNFGARYVLRVPRRVELDRITSSNGSIRLDSLEGMARLRTSNGAVRLLRQTGSAEIETSNGAIEVAGHKGALTARTSNGSIRADLTDPEPGKPVKLDSSNGSITLTMDALRKNDIRATTSNSSITLKLPSSAAGQIRAHTSNSNITSEFEVAMDGKSSKSSLEGTLNGGGPLMELTTSNGSIRLLKL